MEEHKQATHFIPCPMCTKKLKDIEEFSSHFKMEHVYSCETCGKELGTKEELKKQIDSNHTQHDCPLCKETFVDKTKLTEHVKASHTYKCVMCSFEGSTVDAMEKHILEKHFTPDENNKFCCDECSRKFESREL